MGDSAPTESRNSHSLGTWLEEAATGVPDPKNRTDQAP